MSRKSRTWTVRGVEGLIATDFHRTGRIAFGWNDLGDLRGYSGIDELARGLNERYPDLDGSAVETVARSLWWLTEGLQLGDHVVAHDPERDVYCIGVVQSRYEHEEGPSPLHHVRRVRWIRDARPEGLSDRSVEAMASVGSVGDLEAGVSTELGRSSADVEGTIELIDDLAWILLALTDD